MLRMDIDALERFLDATFPQAVAAGYTIAALDEGHLRLELTTGKQHLRPGGTVAGPVMMSLADSATYLLVLAHLGPVALAVTTNLNIHFMQKPEPGLLCASTSLLKLGKRIAVAEVRLHGPDPDLLYAHATVTYSLPPAR